MGERVVGLAGQLKRWMVVSSDREQGGGMERGIFRVNSVLVGFEFGAVVGALLRKSRAVSSTNIITIVLIKNERT